MEDKTAGVGQEPPAHRNSLLQGHRAAGAVHVKPREATSRSSSSVPTPTASSNVKCAIFDTLQLTQATCTIALSSTQTLISKTDDVVALSGVVARDTDGLVADPETERISHEIQECLHRCRRL